MRVLKTKIRRKALAAAWAYRRCAKQEAGHFNHDFSYDALLAMYNYETYGRKKYPEPSKITNGYTYGKWLMDLSVAMWKEELALGNFTKAELLEGGPTAYRDMIRNAPCTKFFTYDHS